MSYWDGFREKMSSGERAFTYVKVFLILSSSMVISFIVTAELIKLSLL